jgi:hypothetical protein
MLKWPDKDPEANKDYALDWTAMLALAETIEDSQWVSTPTGLTVGTSAIVDGVCSVWLSGGSVGITYTVVNTITTDRGLIDERSVAIKIKEQ